METPTLFEYLDNSSSKLLESFPDMTHIRDNMTPWSAFFSSSVVAVSLYLLIATFFFFAFGEYKKESNTFANIKRQIHHSVIALLSISPFGGVFQYLIVKQKIGYLYYDWNEWGMSWLIISFCLYGFILDAFVYWIHRALHTDLLYRHFHAGHHKYHPVSSFSSSSIDFFDILITGLLPAYIPSIFLTSHISTFFFYSWWSLIWSIYLHCVTAPNLKYGPLNDNEDHYNHHQSGRFNYSIYSRTWDLICGTYYRKPPSDTQIKKTE